MHFLFSRQYRSWTRGSHHTQVTSVHTFDTSEDHAEPPKSSLCGVWWDPEFTSPGRGRVWEVLCTYNLKYLYPSQKIWLERVTPVPACYAYLERVWPGSYSASVRACKGRLQVYHDLPQCSKASISQHRLRSAFIAA